MHPQEQEERDYYPQTDLQNAYAWSSMNRQPDDHEKIIAALDAGKYVVVEVGTEYCRSTDAILGSRRLLASTHDTRQEAELAASQIEGHEDLYVEVLPYPHPALKHESASPDEIPF